MMYKYRCNHCVEIISEVPLFRCPCCGGTITNANDKPKRSKRAERRREKKGNKK